MVEESQIIDQGYYKNIPHYNTEEFCASARHFEEFGRYTNYPINDHPSSRYYKFWEEEARRCVYGYNIGRDWISGYNYSYLNYSPIFIAVEEQQTDDADKFNLEKLLQQGRADREMHFPEFWDGDYRTFHYYEEAEASGEHAIILKARGRGYSFKGASMLLRNYYLIPGSKSYVFAADKAFIIEDGILTKAWEMLDHIEQHTPWGKRRQRNDSVMHKRSSYYTTQNGLKVEKGFKSEIIGLSLKNNWNKARGKRGKLLLYEEAGAFPNLLKAWNMSLKSMQQGRLTFGLQVGFGTGGTEGEDIFGLDQLFYEGRAYNVHVVPNRWDKGAGNTRSGHFVSVEENMEGTMDKEGNTNYELSRAIVEKQRQDLLKETKNPESIVRFMAEEPRTPEEALMRISGTIFPINDLKAHMNYLRANPERYEDTEYVGRLELDQETEKIVWKPDDKVRPIKKFPELDRKYIEGGVVIYEHPVENSKGEIPYGIYIAGNDAYDHDESTTDSLGSTFIMNRLTKRIVAEYTGRPATANEYYETLRRLLLYYHATCNYENNWKGLFTYLNNRHSAHLLCDTPRIVADKIYDKSLLNRGKGTPGTSPIQKWGRELILIWLTEPVSPGSEITNLYKIRSIPLLQELIYWHEKGNFDRVDALQMLLILAEDMQNIEVEENYKNPQEALSPFFRRMEMFQAKRATIADPFSKIAGQEQMVKLLNHKDNGGS